MEEDDVGKLPVPGYPAASFASTSKESDSTPYPT
ncbi:hypothetical protein COLO4_02004 [Corchorus olitorius]|uniref:Uncharacterized protein n=1 Tax=Corchorus olitorius TaxID=93759 RepID=A0A1R3L1N4_9ROSI|nr:hypothetical protein COLO4_02004 [Corchorus olitorius]